MTDYIWDQTVDDFRFRCTVERTSEYSGTLVVTVTETGDELLREPVTLAFGARFGPDVADVQDWQDRSIAAIDAWLARQ